jgi:hypothetical protein
MSEKGLGSFHTGGVNGPTQAHDARARRGFSQRLLMGLTSAVCIILYQNCGTDFVPLDDLRLASLGQFICGSNLEQTYAKTYHPFVVQNCVGCHGGSQSPKFALSDPSLAYKEFQLTTQATFRSYALNPSHGGAAGGPKNQIAVNKAETNFNSCKSDTSGGGGETVITARTQPLPVNATGALQVRVYNNLGGQLQMGSMALAGAQLDFQVRVDSTVNPPAYVIARPRLQTGAAAIRVKGLFVMINGTRITTATAFKGLDRTIAANTTFANGTLATASAIFEYPGAQPTTDTVQFEFEILAAQ